MKQLTQKQSLVLDIIRTYIEQYRIPPTTREIAEKLGVCQTAAMNYVNVLVKKGFIAREPLKSRTITLVNESQPA